MKLIEFIIGIKKVIQKLRDC